MSSFLEGIRLACGFAVVWAAVQWARLSARHAARRWQQQAATLSQLAHPEPVCLVRHQHKGRDLADFLRRACPAVSDADLAAMCRAAQGATLIADRRHGGHAARVLLCDLDGAVRELQGASRMEAPQ